MDDTDLRTSNKSPDFLRAFCFGVNDFVGWLFRPALEDEGAIGAPEAEGV